MEETENRKTVANLLKNVLLQKMSVAKACLNFPKNSKDKSIQAAFFALAHVEADEDLRKRSKVYASEQDDYILYLSQTLESGKPLPQNIIASYEKYYDKAPIYPELNKKNILEILKKSINI